MSLLQLVFLSIGLAMDAFAMAVCKGLSMKKVRLYQAVIIGLFFGFFQFIMPVIGYYLGASFSQFVGSIDHWIALILLGFIGINMIKEGFSNDDEDNNNELSLKELLMLSIATSIDALAVGISFAFLKVNIIQASLLVGIITCSISILGVYIGRIVGSRLKNYAEITGGIILIIIALKMVVEEFM